MSSLTGQTALVTGSSRGIGAAIARLFAAHGASVAVHGRDVDALTRVREEIEGAGGQVIAVTAELTRFSEIERMRDEIERRLGGVTLLVANAGGSATRPVPFEEIGEDDWRASVETNLTATFLTLKCFLPGMKARGAGTIITLSSAAARRAHPKSPVAYSAAKAGIQMLTQHLAAQVGSFGSLRTSIRSVVLERLTMSRARPSTSHRRNRRGSHGLSSTSPVERSCHESPRKEHPP
jgi:3-oxoacyl-[acyl-carrier protein] reductase